MAAFRHWLAGVLATALVAASSLAYVAWRAHARAEESLTLALELVDDSIALADRDPGALADEAPAQAGRRQELLETAERFYAGILAREPQSEASRSNAAIANLRLGHVRHMRERFEEAALAYRAAVSLFETLARAYPEKPQYAAGIGSAYRGMGDAIGSLKGRHAEAAQAYERALAVQERVVQADPANPQSQSELARTYYNRGQLRAGAPDGLAAANADFRESIRLLEPIAASSDRTARELARAYNSLGRVLDADPQRKAEVRAFREKAIGIVERLAIRNAGNREYKRELAAYCHELAAWLQARGAVDEAARRSRMAVDLIESVARPGPALQMAHAGAHTLHGRILQPDDPMEAVLEYEEALDLLSSLRHDRDPRRLPELHERLDDLLASLASLPRRGRHGVQAGELLADAAALYAETTASLVASGSHGHAVAALERLARTMGAMPEPQRSEMTEFAQQLHRRFEGDAPRP